MQPPVPATYLVGIPTLEDELLAAGEDPQRQRRKPPRVKPTAADLARARAAIARLRVAIRRAREAYEREHDVIIEPEPPLSRE